MTEESRIGVDFSGIDMNRVREAIYGVTLKVVANDFICVSHELKQYRFPRQKSHRRQKKWRKNRNNWRPTRVEHAYRVNDRLLVSRRLLDEIKKRGPENPMRIMVDEERFSEPVRTLFTPTILLLDTDLSSPNWMMPPIS